MYQTDYFRKVVRRMRLTGVTFEAGLIDNEIDEIENRCNFNFPPDLKHFLYTAHPLLHGDRAEFPNWRDRSVNHVTEGLAWITEGICAHVEYERHPWWTPEWGERPKSMADALEIAKREVAKAPLLIPIYGHRFLTADPCIAGNPVFSIMETDIIHYGFDLAGYFHHEFGVPLPEWTAKTPRCVPFWSDFDLPCGENRTQL